MKAFFENLILQIKAIAKKYLDPDRQWFSKDKWQHGVAFVVIGFLLSMAGEGFVRVLIDSAVIGFTYEVGQADSSNSAEKITGVKFLGSPGFGVSPLDLAWDEAGAIAGAGLWLLVTLIF